jgi:hypothetical protein
MLQSLCDFPSLIPDVYGAVEPMREQFSHDDLDAISEKVHGWRTGFMWRHRKPQSWGAIYPNYSPRPKHTLVNFNLNIGTDAGESDAIGLLKNWSRALLADFGFVEPKPAKPSAERPSPFVTTRDLLKGIPQFFWATVFGPPYVELFGRDRLSGVPAAVNIELAPNLFYIQLTEHLSDVIERPEIVDKARQAAKEHLGLDAFVIAPGAATAARVPKFSFVAPQPAA